MYKDERYINAGTNEIYRYGNKAQEKVKRALTPNEQGFYSIPTDGGKYWTIGTSDGKYGEYAKVCGTIFSVNKAGKMWAKAGTDKAEYFINAISKMLENMQEMNLSRIADFEEE